ncbi:hypothetical protein MMB232_02720 [Brevundimonas subvibrioides]|uniref:hypothetical protein n=1 Tax=Brevundimonas subvibrioides TaxID=74313 RepID=UPI0032D577D5
MLTALMMATMLQQAAPVWDTPRAEPAAVAEMAAPPPDLPAWALADPFGWERSQCSPLLRKDASMEACQARVRRDLSAALGDRLPAGLQPPGEPVPCLATPDDTGAYPVQCGLPERRTAQAVTPRIAECRSRPTRQGGSVAFVTECEPEAGETRGLTFRLGDRD